jgi:hypothetical protein
MNKVTLSTGILAIGFSANTLAENYYLPSHVEQGLIQVCKSAANDKLLKMNKSIKALNLKGKTVALNVICNGKDIISFAEHYGAKRTVARLNKKLGSVEIIDLAAVGQKRYDVTFDFK